MKSPASDSVGAFAEAISGAGFPVPEHIIADGNLHRFSTNGKGSDDAGWYVLHDGEMPAGAFGCWRTGWTQKWAAVRPDTLDKSDARKLREKWRAIQRQRKAERDRRQADAARRALEIWRTASPAPSDNPYLTAKGISAHGVRTDEDGVLIIPMSADCTLCSLQLIDPTGEKLFLPGGRVCGTYYAIGRPDDLIVVCEGFATGASIHEATGAAVAVAFNAGNLKKVAESLRSKYPDIQMVIAADNDIRDDGSENVGVAKATEAAQAVGGQLAVPELENGKCDFNDVHCVRGLDEVMRQFEGLYTPSGNRATVQPLTEMAQSLAPKLAYSQDILSDFRRDVRLHGLIGEYATAQLLYLAVTSRLLNKPVSIGVKGHSSSGKSWVVGRVLDFFPEEAVVTFTGMSERALIYREDSYSHRTIVIYEVTGLREGNEDDLASYFMRSLLSEGRIEYDVTVRGEDGQYTAQRITKEGPTNLVFTTTKTRVHSENETRILSLNTDDGAEQTRNVLAAMADESERDVDLQAWRKFQAWLQVAEHKVTIPYSRTLADAVPPLAVRLRRDFASVLALIRAHAILHQCSRERDKSGRIIATMDDYVAVRELVSGVVSEGIGATVSDTVRETVSAVDELADESGVTVTDVAKRLGVDKSAASRRIRRAADGGYIRNKEDKRGRPGRWVIGEPLPETIEVLPQPSTLCNPETRATPSGCTVDAVQWGVYRGAASDYDSVDSDSGSISPKTGVQPCNTSDDYVEGSI
ncbi:MAG: toprim domain-containing protein [Nitrococcus mobilis]|nr:toprim domain-containing protein [Nitrococcus mobilis]